jgi:type II restriction enzyme
MNLSCDITIASAYSSSSQRARVISEDWLARNGFCLACTGEKLKPTPRNTQARDFECIECGHPYELKCTLGEFGNQITDGAYSSMMKRIENSSTPSFLLLGYTSTWSISSFQAIHHLLITPSAIKARKPLAITAKRAGWIGCNILLSQIPREGRIDIVKNGVTVLMEQSRQKFAQSERLIKLSVSDRTWTAEILNLIHGLNKSTFTLQEAYSFENRLAMLYPSNFHIREKIRQQLQVLRDMGFLQFISRGTYRLTRV